MSTFIRVWTFSKIFPLLYPPAVLLLKGSAYLEENLCVDYWLVVYGSDIVTCMSDTTREYTL
jgi:hypothetical protein